MTEETIFNFINDNGQFFVSRRSVNHPFRLGLKFNKLQEEDIKVVKQLGYEFGGSFTIKKLKSSYTCRIISNRFIMSLIDGSSSASDVFYASCISNKKLCETFNELTSEEEELEAVMVDEDLPF